MRHQSILRACGVLGLLALVSAATAGAAPATGLYVENEVIVQFRTGVTLAAARQMAAAQGATVAKSFRTSTGPVALVRATQSAASVDVLMARFRSQPSVVYAEPNFRVFAPTPVASTRPDGPAPTRPFQTQVATLRGQPVMANTAAVVAAGVLPNDPFVQDGFASVEADVIWSSTTASPVVAVLDTGVDYLHPDLVGKVVKGRDFINDDTDPMDDNGHGTHVAGIIAAKLNNKIGISGVSNGSVLAIKVLDYAGGGTHFDVAAGIDAAAATASVKVINMSLGGTAEGVTLRYAVARAVNVKGKLVIAAAGNDDTNALTYPAAYSVWDAIVDPGVVGATPAPLAGKVLAVGASGAYVTGSGDSEVYYLGNCKASYSNWGTWVNVVAPGTDIYSTMPYQKPFWREDAQGYSRDYDFMSGTSMAAPHAAGTAARIWSVNPTFTNVKIAERMTGGGTVPAPVILADTTADIDVDGDTVVDLAFCWDPAWATNGGTDGRTLTDLAETNVPFGMQRGRISGFVADGSNGLPLTGAVLQAFSGTVLKGTSLAVSNLDWGGFTGVNNVPWSATPYTVKVNKAGYTSGAQAFEQTSLYGISSLSIGEVPVPKLTTGVTFVTTMGLSTDNNLNQVLMLPSPGAPGAPVCEVGASSLTAPATDCGVGNLSAAPYARLLAESTTLMSPQVFETTAIKSPLYSTAAAPYRLFLHDVVDDGASIEAQMPTVRMWKGGVIKARVDYGVNTTAQADCSFTGGGAAICNLWYLGDLTSAGVFTPVDQMGDGTNYAVLPFSSAFAYIRSLSSVR